MRIHAALAGPLATGLLALAVSAAAVAAATAAAWADAAGRCESVADPDAKIEACSAAILSGDWTGAELAWAYNNRAIAFHDKGEHARAVEDYAMAIELDPTDPRAWYNRGISYRKLGRVRRAVEDYDRAIALDPDHGSAYYNRGAAYELMGDVERAIADTERALALEGAPRVRALQEHLKAAGLYDGEIDGIYGGGTEAALRACIRAPEC